MIAEETLRRYVARWAPLALGGLFPLLVNLVLALVSTVVVGAAMLGGGMNLLLMERNPTALLAAAGSLGAAALVVAIAGLVAAPFGQGGLTYAVVQVQRDQSVSFGELWQAALRYWGRLFRLNLIMAGAGIIMLLVFFLLRFIPLLGPLVWVIGFALVMFVLGGYGPYLVVSEELGASDAAGKAFRILTRKFVDVVLTLLVMAAAGLAVGLVTGILSLIPGLGLLVTYASQIFLAPLAMLYLAFRYQRNIAPDLNPPGGRGRFDMGPPPGA
ncbi:MAG TPA: hypothetical protein VD973_12790 [Symbiobacteriaceae bacterium]|nr:hypothetical protein [Symbiobacteriaceae bacterium]